MPTRRGAKKRPKPATRHHRAEPAASAPRVQRALLYKVVELSNVDEHALEHTVNEWVSRGWHFDGVQFAMRESSKRPSMGFVFFTREGAEIVHDAAPASPDAFRSDEEAEAQLKRVILGAQAAPESATSTPVDAWQRLKELAGDDE